MMEERSYENVAPEVGAVAVVVRAAVQPVAVLRIPAEDAMCASHPFFRGFGVIQVLSQGGVF